MVSFLDLPWEVRNHIYRFLLVKNTGTSQAIDVTDTLTLHYRPHPSCPWEHVGCSQEPTKWHFSSPRLPNIGSAAILRTCKRIAEEGAEVLYGSTTISCMPGHALHASFMPTIGAFNSSCIRSVHLWMHAFFTSGMIHLTNTQFQRRLHDSTRFLVNLVNQKLSQLQHLVLGIPAAGCHHLNLNIGLPSANVWWVRAHCAMLWFSAWTTARHPRLKRAVWSQQWISRYTPENAEDLQYLDISVKITAPWTKWGTRNGEDFEEVAWYVRQDLLSKGLPMQSIKVSIIFHSPRLGTRHMLTALQGIPLDSRAIRRQGVGGIMASHNPLSYNVDEVANTSEVGQAKNLLEDISDRFGYKETEQDNATRARWGDLEGLYAQRLASKTQHTTGAPGWAIQGT